ncbi:hypothetical protein [Paenibacillus kribbensis]|uniref:hypothetical protein n=1 Tax=Paenibacillus kribbensis TaxID=172713 RepID=UPI000837DDA0|nr:hypothetical protein [Paenibacillus kribbensis]
MRGRLQWQNEPHGDLPHSTREDGEEHPLYKDEGHGMSDMALHLKNFEIFFNLYLPALNMIQKAVLKKCLPFLFQLTQADITNIAITEDIDPLREEIRGC